MAATLSLALVFALPQAGAGLAGDPVQPGAAIKAVDTTARTDVNKSARPSMRRLDSTACAELCRLFERMWSLEKRVPETSAPTS